MLDQEREIDPGFVATLSGRLDLALGWASNARAGSPVDPADAGNSADSPAVQLSGWMRFVSPHRARARPALEVEGRGLGLSSASERDVSHLMLDAKPEVIISALGRQAILGYRYQALMLAGGDRYEDGPLWFFEAHRAEWEVEMLRALPLFGGVGKRVFRDVGRTHWEVDAGAESDVTVTQQLHLLGALSGRFYDANDDAHDVRGASFLLSTEARLPRRWSVRGGFLAGLDDYPHSMGYFDPAAPGSARRDLLLRSSASAFSPSFGGRFKLGLTYELAWRDSSARPYAYQDHRVLAKLVYSFAADPWLPRELTPTGHVPIDYGFEDADVADRVQDLLRQDEGAQRSSSCRD